MKCNTKQTLVGTQKKTKTTNKKINGRVNWNPNGPKEIRYEQDSICENGHVEHWTSKQSFNNIKWKCRVAIFDSQVGKVNKIKRSK